MKNSMNFRSILLSLTLGLFTFHLYIAGHLVVEKEARRELASVTCIPFTDAKKAEQAEGECKFSYIYDKKIYDNKEGYTVDFILPKYRAKFKVAKDELEINEDRIDGAIISKATSEAPITNPNKARYYIAEAILKGVTLDKNMRNLKATYKNTEKTLIHQRWDNDKKEPTLENSLKNLEVQVKELPKCNKKKAEKLLSKAKEFLNIEQEIEDTESVNERRTEAENDLNKLKKLLAQKNKCKKAKEHSDNPSEQWRVYTTKMLPTLRQELATAGAIDEMSGFEDLKDLARANSRINKALAIEVRAYTASAGIAENTAIILQAKNTPGADPALIKNLEGKNKILLGELASLSDPSISGKLSPFARNAVTYWSTFFGRQQAAQIALMGPAQKVLEEGVPVNEAFGANLRPNVSSAGVKDINALDSFLRQVRETYQNTRVALDNTRNRVGENARVKPRKPAPRNRRLDFLSNQPRALQ